MSPEVEHNAYTIVNDRNNIRHDKREVVEVVFVCKLTAYIHSHILMVAYHQGPSSDALEPNEAVLT